MKFLYFGAGREQKMASFHGVFMERTGKSEEKWGMRGSFDERAHKKMFHRE